MPTRSSMSSMVTWSRLGYRPPLPPNDPQPSAWTGRPNPAAAAGWGHRLARDGTPKTRPSLASKTCLLPPRAPCQQRGFCPDPGGWGREMETESRGPEGLYPCPRGKAGASEDLPHPQRRTNGLALASDLRVGDGCLQEPSQSLPPRSSPPTAPASPHFVFREDASNCGPTAEATPSSVGGQRSPKLGQVWPRGWS